MATIVPKKATELIDKYNKKFVGINLNNILSLPCLKV